MELLALKARLKTVQPFITKEFFGQENCLAKPGSFPPIPLKVALTPPSGSFFIESGHMTSLVLRYSKTYRNQIKKANAEQPGKDFSKKVLDEVKEKIMSSDEEQAEQIGLMVKLGKEYLIAKAVYCYWDNEADRARIVFTNSKETADLLNESATDEIAVYVETLTDEEIIKVGLELMSAMPTDSPANIPIVETEADETGTAKEVVTSSVPADKLANFPRRTRDIVVEDVPESSGTGVRDSGTDSSV